MMSIESSFAASRRISSVRWSSAELGSSETLMVYAPVEHAWAMVSPAPLSGLRYQLRVALLPEPPLLQAARLIPARDTPRTRAARRGRRRRPTDTAPVADGMLIWSPWNGVSSRKWPLSEGAWSHEGS